MALGINMSLRSFKPFMGAKLNPISLSPDAYYDPQDHSSVLTGNDTEALYRQPVATLKDLTANGYDLTQTTAANQLLYLRHGEDGYLGLSGTEGHYASLDSRSEYNITGDIDLRGKVSTVFGSTGVIVAKRHSTGGNKQYIFRIQNSGELTLFLNGDSGEVGATSSVALPFNDNEVFWARAAWSDSANEVTFYTSLDGETWTQLGTPQSLINTNLATTTQQLEIGSYNNGDTSLFNGRIFQAQIRDGIDGFGLSETLTDATDTILSANFNHDGSLLAAGSDDNNVRIYNTSTWSLVETLTEATDSVWSVNFNHDGSLLAVGSWDNNTRIYNTSNWSLIETLTEATDLVWSVNFNHDGSLLAVGSGDNNVRIYNTSTWNVIETLTEATDRVWSVNFNHDGSLLAVGGQDNNVRIYNTSTWSLVETLTEATDSVWSVNFNHDGSLLAVGSADNNVRIYNTSTWNLVETLTDATISVRSVNFNHDGSLLAVGSSDNNVRIYNTSTWNLVETLTDATSSVRSVNFNHDGSLLAAGSQDDNTYIYDTDVKADLVYDANFEDATGGETTWTNSALGDTITTHAPTNIPNGLTGKTKSYLHLPGEDGNYASTPSQAKYNITGDIDLRGKVSAVFGSTNAIIAKRSGAGNRQYIFRIEGSGNLRLFLNGDEGEVSATSSVALPFNDNEVFWARATWSDSANEVTFYTSLDGETWTQLGTPQSLINTNLATSTQQLEIGSNDDGNTSLFNGQIFQAQIRDGIDGFGLSETLTDATDTILSANFNHDGSLLAVGGADNNVRIYNTSTWAVVETLTDATSWVYSVNFNHDSSLLAVGSFDNNVKIYNTSTWNLVETLTEATDFVYSVNFNHDSSLLAVGSSDNNARIYDTSTWTLSETLTDAAGRVYSVNFNHDGSLLAVGSWDNNVRIYNTSTWNVIETLTDTTDRVRSVNFNHDGSLLAVGSNDNNVRVYDTSTWNVVETLTEAREAVWSVNFNHDGSLLAVGSQDNNVRIYNTSTWGLAETLTNTTDRVRSVNFNHDGSLLAAGSQDDNTYIYDTDLKADLVYDANFEDLKHGVDSFTENEGATVTVNRSGDDQALVVGRSMLWFDGVDDYLGIANAPAGLRKPYQEIVGVGFNFGAGDGHQRLASRATGSGGEGGYAYYFHDNRDVRYDISGNSIIIPNAYPTEETFIGVAYINGTNRVVRTNGEDKNVEPFTGTISNVADEFRIGSDAGFTFEREWNGFLGQIFIKGRDTAGETLSDNDRKKLEKYFAKKFNITLS